jgi:formate hydrogenlyase transcriptional activator
MKYKDSVFDVEKIEQATVQFSANSVLWLNRKAEIMHANSAACELLMYDYEILTRMKSFDIAPAYTPECGDAKRIMELKKGEKHTFETVVVNRHKMKIPVEVTVFEIRVDEENYFCSIFFNITQRKKMMTKLINSEEKIRAIFNNHFQLAGLLDVDGRLLMINQTALSFIDVSEDQVLGKYFWQTPWFGHSKALQKEVKTYCEKAAQGHFVRAEWEIFDKLGKKVVFDNTLKPVKNANGDIRFLLPEARDITEMKKTENDLKAAYKQLERLKDRLQNENLYLKEELRENQSNSGLIGQSPAFNQVLFQIDQVARINTTVLIQGETGTGKELVAHRIHDLSIRRDQPLVKLNCAAIPSNLIESELFGHEKGAFTGAHALKIGRFELADKGTIFLDEIGELSIDLQAKLLRVLQESEFERIGGTRTLKVDIRIIAATNRDLKAMIAANKFREDLYYRLHVFPINIPPLREREGDVQVLSRFLIKQISKRIGKKIKCISKSSMEKLKAYHWPGNIRELINVLERSAVLSQQDVLEIGDWFQADKTGPIENHGLLTLDKLQRRHIIRVLKETKGRIRGDNGAAHILGLKPTTLESRMIKLKINKYEISEKV